MIETTKIIQSLCYILGKINRASKLKLVKLLYLADKAHLIRYGRTITNDEYWAMSYGPVGSVAKDLLAFDPEFLASEFEFVSKMLRKVDENTFESASKCERDDLDMLSDSDIEALDLVISKFGKRTASQLVTYTHRYPEWKQYERLFEEQRTKREKIETSELISVIDKHLAMPEDHMKESKEILNGTFS